MQTKDFETDLPGVGRAKHSTLKGAKPRQGLRAARGRPSEIAHSNLRHELRKRADRALGMQNIAHAMSIAI